MSKDEYIAVWLLAVVFVLGALGFEVAMSISDGSEFRSTTTEAGRHQQAPRADSSVLSPDDETTSNIDGASWAIGVSRCLIAASALVLLVTFPPNLIRLER